MSDNYSEENLDLPRLPPGPSKPRSRTQAGSLHQRPLPALTGPHLEPTAPQEARLVHRGLVRTAGRRPAPPRPARPRRPTPLAKQVS